MKTDRELLELAAKAAGLDAAWEEWRTAHIGAFKTIKHERHEGLKIDGKSWNPLTDDGDALRLAVKLRMRVSTPTSDTDCEIAGRGDIRVAHVNAYSEDEILDNFTATRRAIVRAAAAIGESIA